MDLVFSHELALLSIARKLRNFLKNRLFLEGSANASWDAKIGSAWQADFEWYSWCCRRSLRYYYPLSPMAQFPTNSIRFFGLVPWFSHCQVWMGRVEGCDVRMIREYPAFSGLYCSLMRIFMSMNYARFILGYPFYFCSIPPKISARPDRCRIFWLCPIWSFTRISYQMRLNGESLTIAIGHAFASISEVFSDKKHYDLNHDQIKRCYHPVKLKIAIYRVHYSFRAKGN
jgi:hypothetical protein